MLTKATHKQSASSVLRRYKVAYLLPLVSRLPVKLSPHSLGHYGELLTRRKLRSTSHTILDWNWQSFSGELDIVAAKSGTLTFVEVKTRRETSVPEFSAAQAIDTTKRERLEQLAREYLHHEGVKVRRNRIRRYRIDHCALSYCRGRWGYRFALEWIVGEELSLKR